MSARFLLYPLGLVAMLVALGGVHFFAATNRPDEALASAMFAIWFMMLMSFGAMTRP